MPRYVLVIGEDTHSYITVTTDQLSVSEEVFVLSNRAEGRRLTKMIQGFILWVERIFETPNHVYYNICDVVVGAYLTCLLYLLRF